MQKRLLPVLLLVLFMAMAAPIQKVEVTGAGPVLIALARIALPFSVGDPTDTVNPKTARQAVLDTGFFKNATVSLSGESVVVKLIPNPTIISVNFKDQVVPAAQLTRLLEDKLVLGPGATYNPKRVAQAETVIASFYRSSGYPFVPKVGSSINNEPTGVTLTFQVDESAVVKKVVIKGATYINKQKLERVFEPLAKSGSFDWNTFLGEIRQVRQMYQDQGYRGSGVDPKRTQLKDGILTVSMLELRIGQINASELGSSVDLGLKSGAPFNYDHILRQLNQASKALGREVELHTQATTRGTVDLSFTLGPKRYGPIKQVELKGVTAVPEIKVRKALQLQPGDIFSPQLAQEDFVNIVRLYDQAGYRIVGQPDFSFQNGIYTQKVSEVKIQGYRLDWQGAHQTGNFVILRQLPQPGALFSVGGLRKGLTQLMGAQLLAGPPQVQLEPGKQADQVVVKLSLKEGKPVLFAPSIGWTSTSGWSGQATISDKNLWGRGHVVGMDLAFVQNSAHDNISLHTYYRIPWLWLPYGDLEQVPTNLSFNFYTKPKSNIPLLDASGQPTGWGYTERRTGFSLSAGRPLLSNLPNLVVNINLAVNWIQPKLQIYAANLPTSPDQATAYNLLPSSYRSFTLGLSGRYSQVDDSVFPTLGWAAQASAAYGLSFPDTGGFSQFAPLSATVKAYYPLSPSGKQVFAARLSMGTILGTAPSSSDFNLGGNQSNLSTLRGYDTYEFSGTRMLGSSLEYRYNFGLKTSVSQTVVGLAFLDLGSTWSYGATPVFHGGYGLGVQLNLGYASVVLPPIQLDYGFSPLHPGGVFNFRLGPMF